MDWRKWVIGVKPKDMADCERQLVNARWSMWIVAVVAVLILFGTFQQVGEVDRCWSDLKVYREADSVIAGLPVSNCFIEDDKLVCDDDFSSIT